MKNNTDEDSDVKNYYYVNGNQNNYNIRVSGNASVKIFGDGEVEFEEIKRETVEYGTPSEVFKTDKAKEYFSKLRKAKYIDENDRPTGLSWGQTRGAGIGTSAAARHRKSVGRV